MKNPLRSSAQRFRASFLHEDDNDDDEKWLNGNTAAAGLNVNVNVNDNVDTNDNHGDASGLGVASTASGGLVNEEEEWVFRNNMNERSTTATGVAAASSVTAALDTNDSSSAVDASSSAHARTMASLRASSGNCSGISSTGSDSYLGCPGRNIESFSSDSDSSCSRSSSSYSSSSYSSSTISGNGFNSVLRFATPTTISASREKNNKAEEVTPHELAAQVAKRVKNSFAKNLPSALKEDYNHRDCVAPYKTDEIVLGQLLGSGEFSHVYEIKAFRPHDDQLSSLDESTTPLTQDEIKTRQHMKRRERYHDTKKACYAVKHLRPALLEKYTKLEYAQSASDLAMEAEFLASLQHPNIIKLRGISASGAEGFADGPKGYFLIIDRLNDTLDARIKTWKKQQRRRRRKDKAGGYLLTSSLLKKRLAAKMMQNISKDPKEQTCNSNHTGGGLDDGNEGTQHSMKECSISEEQVDVGLQISSALMYLHEKNVMFRDLKPQNVGFDVRGDVKLFDFGLATFMPIFGDPYENKYNMSGAGSPRYMAPEVLINPPEHYNLKADVYTFGMVLWEMFSLETPFSHVKTRKEMVEHVVHQDGRPTINENWPDDIKEVLHLSFDPDTTKRPTIQLFYNLLRFHLLDLRNGDDTGLRHTFIKRRRSFSSSRQLDVDSNDEQKGQTATSPEKFPQRVRDKILSHVKSPATTSSNNSKTGVDDQPAQPQRRRRNKLRDKFRLSVKNEE